MNFGGFNLEKAKELLEGGANLDAKTLIELLQKMVNEPEKGGQLVDSLKQEVGEETNIIEVVQKLYSYAKKFGLI